MRGNETQSLFVVFNPFDSDQVKYLSWIQHDPALFANEKSVFPFDHALFRYERNHGGRHKIYLLERLIITIRVHSQLSDPC